MKLTARSWLRMTARATRKARSNSFLRRLSCPDARYSSISDLAQRFAAQGDAKQAERAYATIVETLPNESESHAMLAEVREKQSRWSDAAAHWSRVAEIRKLEPTGLLKLGQRTVATQKLGRCPAHDPPIGKTGLAGPLLRRSTEGPRAAQQLNGKKS